MAMSVPSWDRKGVITVTDQVYEELQKPKSWDRKARRRRGALLCMYEMEEERKREAEERAAWTRKVKRRLAEAAAPTYGGHILADNAGTGRTRESSFFVCIAVIGLCG